jgi:hypothetical protein
MKKNEVRAWLLCGIAIAGGSAHAASNLVANGSFELGPFGLGSFQGWQVTAGDANTFVDSSGETGPLYGQASDGLWSAYLGSGANVGGTTLAQTLDTVAGQTYVLAFDLANDNGGIAPGNGFSVSIDGVQIFGAANLPAQNYVHEHLMFTAASGSSALAISAYNDASWTQLDTVSVSAVPEPSSAWLAIAGLALGGGFGALRRGCRARSA